MRAALGASRGRIARALLSESVVLALAGGVLGVALAQAAIALLRTIAPAELPRVDDIAHRRDGLAVHAGRVAAERRALRPHCRRPVRNAEHHGAQGGRPIGKRRSRPAPHPQCARRRTSRAGADVAHRLWADDSDVRRDAPGRSGVHAPRGSADVRARHTGRPHQRSTTGGAHASSASRSNWRACRASRPSVSRLRSRWTAKTTAITSRLRIPDCRRDDGQAAAVQERRAGYFETMGNRLVAGRSITWSDIHEQRPVVVISEPLAREYWEEPAQGDRQAHPRQLAAAPWREIVGVVGDERDDGLTQPPTAIVYWPMLNESYRWRTMAYAVRSTRVGHAGFPPRARAGGLVGQSESAAGRPCRHSRRSRRAR